MFLTKPVEPHGKLIMIERLEAYLRELTVDGIALAYSGGVDSTLLLAVLAGLKQEKPFAVTALTMHTVLQDSREITEAKGLAEKFGIEQKIFSFNPFSAEAVRHNRTDRCYHCKKAIFTQFAAYARDIGLKYLLDGTNADDLGVYRPGRKALSELGVVSPLAELGIGKAEIRMMSAKLGLPTASKPAAPCLATRFEYNTLIDDAAIHRVAKGEQLIKEMFSEIKDIRLRVHGNLARIEVEKEALPLVLAQNREISEKIKKLGFDFVTLDLEGFCSGSFDRGLRQN